MKYLHQIIILAFLLIACDKDDNDSITNIVKPEFVTSLNPVDEEGQSYDVSNNVIQGIVSFEDGWFVTQKSANSILLINYLNENGESLFRKRLYINSHGQDLSLEVISENEIYLYTSQGTFGENRNTGILKLKVTLASVFNNQRDWALTDVSVNNQYNLNYSNSTPVLNEEKNQFAIRSADVVYIHEKDNLENSNFNTISNFQLHNEQLRDNGNYSMFFQGIAMKGDLVFCLAGNEKIGTNKSIYTYNNTGVVTNKYEFDRNDLSQNFYDKFEPEGLAFKDDALYFTIMTKSEVDIGNLKYLYKINL